MRYEGKSEQDAVEEAARALSKNAAEIRYKVIRDEESFWGGRGGEIEVEGEVGSRESGVGSPEPEVESARPPERREPAPAGATGQDAVAITEATLDEPLS